jgi:polygalacturonase
MDPTFEPVFDVTKFGARPGVCTVANTRKMQKAIDAAGRAGGGVVYFPAGRYFVTHGLFGDSNITLRGASLGNLDASSASVIQTSPGVRRLVSAFQDAYRLG